MVVFHHRQSCIINIQYLKHKLIGQCEEWNVSVLIVINVIKLYVLCLWFEIDIRCLYSLVMSCLEGKVSKMNVAPT